MASIVLLGSDCDATRIVYHALVDHLRIERVVLEQPVGRLQLVRRRLKRLGAARVAGMLGFQLGLAPWLRWQGRERIQEICEAYGLSTEPIPETEVERVKSCNSRAAIACLEGCGADAVLVNGTRILGARILREVGVPFVNTHAGVTPLYRGVHGGYWALAQRDPANFGVTVHRIDRGIDTGGILAQATVAPTPADTFATYPYLQLAAALPLLRRILPALAGGASLPEQAPPPGPSRLWYHPTLSQYLSGWWMYGVR